jgi:hypothetical protein
MFEHQIAVFIFIKIHSINLIYQLKTGELKYFINESTTNVLLQGMSQLSVFGFVVYILCSLTSIGLVLENHPQARALEVIRCVVLAALVRRGAIAPLPTVFAPALQLFFAFSAVLCTLHSVQRREYKHKTT